MTGRVMAKLRGGHGLRGTDLGQLLEAESETTSPSRLLELANIRDTSIHFALTDNPATPLEALCVLARTSRSAHVILEAVHHPTFTDIETPAAFERLYKLNPKMALANGLCPPSVFATAVHSEDREMRLMAARNSMCPIDLLEILAADSAYQVREAVARNPFAGSLLPKLARDRNAWVRAAVAGHGDLGQEDKELLFTDKSLVVLEALTYRANLRGQEAALVRARFNLAKNRARVNRKPSAATLAKTVVESGVNPDSYGTWRDSRVASVRILAKLLAYDADLIDRNECVAELATEKQNAFVLKFLHHIDPVKALHLMEARGMAGPIQGILRKDWVHSADVARTVVMHGSYEQILQAVQICPLEVDVLDALSRLPVKGCYLYVPAAVKYEAALRRTTNTSYGYFRPAVVPALHADTSEASLVRLRASRDGLVRAAMLWRLADADLAREARGPVEVRLALARYSRTPPEVLHTLARDSDRNVRFAVAANPLTRPEDRALVALIGDK